MEPHYALLLQGKDTKALYLADESLRDQLKQFG